MRHRRLSAPPRQAATGTLGQIRRHCLAGWLHTDSACSTITPHQSLSVGIYPYMPSSSWPFVLRFPKRKTKLVLQDNHENKPEGRRATSTGSSQWEAKGKGGRDVIPRRISKLWGAGTHVRADPNYEDDTVVASSPLSAPVTGIGPSSQEMSLNAEPAAPEEREAQELPPKSYAEAARACLPSRHQRGIARPGRIRRGRMLFHVAG